MPGSKRKPDGEIDSDNDYIHCKRPCQVTLASEILPVNLHINGASSVQPMQCSFPDEIVTSTAMMNNNGSHSSQMETFRPGSEVSGNGSTPCRPPGLVPVSPRRCLRCLSGEPGHINHILA